MPVLRRCGIIWHAAASALALGMGIDVADIRAGLRQYGKDFPAAGYRSP